MRGRVKTLEKLVALRFGPPSETALDRLHSASEADLDRITERILSATSLAELFGDG